MLLETGRSALRVKDIAERAGISPSAVLYYYPDLDDLLLEVTREAMSRYAERRAAAVRGIDDPRRQLRAGDRAGGSDRPGRRGQPAALRARRHDRREPAVRDAHRPRSSTAR